jgi:hypothetical protein
VLGYARTFFLGGIWRPEKLPAFDDEVGRFHSLLEDLGGLVEREAPRPVSAEQLLQGTVCRCDDPCGSTGDAPPAARFACGSGEFYPREDQRRKPWSGPAATGGTRSGLEPGLASSGSGKRPARRMVNGWPITGQ